MAYDNRRPDRVAAAIREEVAGFLADGVKDPRVRGLVTVTGVDVTRDLRHARIFVSVLGSDAERDETLAALGDVSAHLRGRVGRALRLRVAPEIAFLRDESVARAARIETLLEQIRRQEPGEDGASAGDDSVDEASADEEPVPDDSAPDVPARPAGD
jgi:ribosome-binding factor A